MAKETFTPCPFLDRKTGICNYDKGSWNLIVADFGSITELNTWLGIPNVAITVKMYGVDPETGKPKTLTVLSCDGLNNLPKQRWCNGNPNRDREKPE